MVKLYSLLIEKFNSFYVTSDDSGNRSKFIFWAIIASVFTERFIVYYCLLQNKNPDGPIFFKEPGFSELMDSLLGFMADQTGVDSIKSLNIFSYIENANFWFSVLVIFTVCYIINRHALVRYPRELARLRSSYRDGKGIVYYALLAHMFLFYISLIKFQMLGLLYFMPVFLTSWVWYMQYKKENNKLPTRSFKNILICNLLYMLYTYMLSFLLAIVMVLYILLDVIIKLWGPSPKTFKILEEREERERKREEGEGSENHKD